VQEYGKNRDIRVLEGIEKFRYMNTPQIAELYFQTIKNPEQRLKKASERMKRMYDRDYVQRFRFPSEPFIFTVKGNKYNQHIQHYLMIVNIWITLQKLKPSGSVLTCEVETKQENVITDLLVEYRNNFRGENKIYWIEVENESSANIIDKVKKYEALAWARRAYNLPAGVLCVAYKKNATIKALEAYTGDLTFKAVSYKRFEQDWTW